MGVAICRTGSGGLEGIWSFGGICSFGGPAGGPPTGFTFGEGGIASPRRGVRAPPPRAPGMAGRSNGAGEDIKGTGLGACDICSGAGISEGMEILIDITVSYC